MGDVVVNRCTDVVRSEVASTQRNETAHGMAHIMHCVVTGLLEQAR